MDNQLLIAERIQSLCFAKKITVNRMLADCMAGTRLVQNLKSGSYPSVDKFIKIANYFGCSVDYLLGCTDNPQVTKELPQKEGPAVPFAPTGQLKELVDIYSALDAAQQNTLLTLAKFLAAGGALPSPAEEMLAEAK